MEDELPSWALESEGSCLALHKHRHITWAYCSLPPLGPRGIQILLGEHTGMLSRTVCVLYCLFIHNCCFLCFSLLANIVEIFLSSCLSLPCPQVKGSPPLLFCFLSLHGKMSKPFLVVLLLQNQISVKFW